MTMSTHEAIEKVMDRYNNWEPGMQGIPATLSPFDTKEVEPKFLLTWEF